MKEIQEILKKVENLAPGERAILATVVDVQGSGYRRAGARMLIDENGFSIGTVSGGCLEADVLERAKKVLETEEPIVVTYDTTKDENSIFGLNMGCRGIVRILLEAISKSSRLFDFLRMSLIERKSFTMATIISDDADEQTIGTRLFLSDGKIIYIPEQSPKLFKSSADNPINLASPSLSEELKNALFDFPKKKSAELVKLSSSEGFFETINPPLNLLLFGAGYDALPLIKFAKQLGWRVTAIDHRPAFANAERLSEADEIIQSASEDLSADLFADENSAAVIMTHNYERDRDILRLLLNSKCFYIGALGPKSRTANLIEELRGVGAAFDEKNLQKIYAPIGLDIGANSPEEIALAIAAEIKTALANRSGGFLRDKNKPIHGD